jgi:L-ascorbate metabolism protein UlaG (beta-lactamase superfamily)
MSLARTLSIISLCCAAFCAPASAKLTVTALDHSGFLFSDGKSKILVDALTEKSAEWPYKAPSSELLGKMERGEKPFDNISLLLISHAHEDHYAPAPTVRFLLAHPRTVLVTTAEVLDTLKPVPGFDKVKSRIAAPDLAWKHGLRKNINGVTLEVDRLKHGDDKDWACQLDAFSFSLGGKKVLYATATAGFFPEEYRDLGYAGRGFDLAFLNYTMAVNAAKGGKPASLNSGGVAKIKTLIAPKTVVLMHITPPAMPGVAAMIPALQKELAGATVFSELESRSY